MAPKASEEMKSFSHMESFANAMRTSNPDDCICSGHLPPPEKPTTIVAFPQKVSMCYHNTRQSKRHGCISDRREKVTQLIGALCEDRTKVILISDRMVTTTNGSLAFEHEPKFQIIAPNAIVLTAGTVHEPEIIAETRVQIKGKCSVLEIADTLSKNYRKIRKKRIENEVLEEMGIVSFDDFHRKQNLLNENSVLELSKKITDYDLGVHLLLGGMDDKAHLYRIGEPGTYRSFDELGFCCIGSGDRHADPVFAFYRFTLSLPLAETLQISFEAKKRAEMAGGVGSETDIWIIEKGGVYAVTPETIKELEESHTEQKGLSQFLTAVKPKTTKLEYQGN